MKVNKLLLTACAAAVLSVAPGIVMAELEHPDVPPVSAPAPTGTAIPGGTGNAAPGATGTTIPGGTGNAAPGATGTAIPGGTGNAGAPPAGAPETPEEPAA